MKYFLISLLIAINLLLSSYGWSQKPPELLPKQQNVVWDNQESDIIYYDVLRTGRNACNGQCRFVHGLDKPQDPFVLSVGLPYSFRDEVEMGESYHYAIIHHTIASMVNTIAEQSKDKKILLILEPVFQYGHKLRNTPIALEELDPYDSYMPRDLIKIGKKYPGKISCVFVDHKYTNYTLLDSLHANIDKLAPLFVGNQRTSSLDKKFTDKDASIFSDIYTILREVIEFEKKFSVLNDPTAYSIQLKQYLYTAGDEEKIPLLYILSNRIDRRPDEICHGDYYDDCLLDDASFHQIFYHIFVALGDELVKKKLPFTAENINMILDNRVFVNPAY